VLQRDPVAFAELCEVALPHLVAFLEARFPSQDSHLVETVVVDLLLDYYRRSDQYDPERLSLFAYFRMAAKYDMLNQISKLRLREARLTPLDNILVELQLSGRNTLQRGSDLAEWLGQYTDLTLREILMAVEGELAPTEQEVLALMLEGQRDTSAFAQVMGIAHLDEADQRREVKRMKDRIMKRLRRLGNRIGRR
jgi:RNA polymerase sigma-70 factor (ECF subfamily)